MKKTFILALALFTSALLLSGCSKSKSSDSDNNSDETYFEVTNSDDMNAEATSSDDNEDSETSFSSSDSNDEDWDEVLNSYDKFADKYIALLKKASKGDVSAVADYAEYMEEAESFSEKLQNASSDLSASQLSRFNKIHQKIIKAASSVNIDPSKIQSAAGAAIDAVGNAMDLDMDDW